VSDWASWAFPVFAVLTWIAVPLYAAIARGRFYAIFAAVILTFSIPAAWVLHTRLVSLWSGPGSEPVRILLDGLFAYSMAAAGIQLAHLVRARLRGRAFRLWISVPGQTFIAAGMLAFPWLLLLLPIRLLLQAFELHQALVALTLVEALPLVVAVLSIATSAATKPETVRFALAREGPDELQRVPVQRFRGREPGPLESRPLRLVQLSDTHLGPWQSVRRLRERIAVLVDRDPDLVTLTGDFLTMESMGSPGCLEDALAPLERVAERCVAIFGNHDHEAPDHVRSAMQNLGIPLLIDDEACFETPAGAVQIVGADFVSRDHETHLGELLRRFPRRPDHLRLLLLHDPVGFRALPRDDVDLVLSGHTHGGQVGLVSLGIDWTVLSRTRWPDQGLFARGATRLYVHRGTGFYGFPLRVGVPAELSLLEVSTAS
jgi:predicted MPP superfamily phosphohydrolase